MERIKSAAEAVVELFGRLGALACIALVLLVAGNVFARYFFREGTIWLQELEWHLISPIALLGMSYTLLKGEQVRVDILFDQMPERGRRAIEVVTGLLIVAFSIIMVRLSIPFVLQAYAMGDSSPNPGGLTHRFLLKALMPLGFVLLAVQGASHTLANTLALFGRTPLDNN